MDANSHEAGGIFDCACTAAPTLLKPERSTNDIKPHRTRIFKLSCDQQFEAKFWDVIGVYLDPPDNGDQPEGSAV
jgi:hypothetical protein